MAEPLEREIGAMVRGLLPEVRSVARAPFAIFGHSMGAVVGFELALALAESGGPEPLIVFASGADAPSRRDCARYAALESDSDLLLELERLEGTPELVLRNAELMEIALPILRADFAACAAYSAPPGRALGCPIHVLGGTRDATSAETLAAWRDHTRRDFTLQMLPGGHFFLHERESDVLASIEARLGELADLAVPQQNEPGTESAAEIERSRARGGQQCQLR
jgi:surfactin synthase thioesterase subunit